MYDPEWDAEVDGPHLIWPPYTDGAVAKGTITERQGRQIRAQYGAKLSMIDHWFGGVLDALDEGDLWDDTVVIVCTDHGHYLGERDIWGKPAVPVYEPLGHIPLMIRWPGIEPSVSNALTTSVCDLFVTPGTAHGRRSSPRHGRRRPCEWARLGVWGREVRRRGEIRAPRQLPPSRCGATAGRRCRCRTRRQPAEATAGPDAGDRCRSSAVPAGRHAAWASTRHH
jgi:hypothetical protein